MVLGVVGLGALGVLAGDWLSGVEQRVLAVVGPRDPTGLTQLLPAGAGFRFYSVTGSVPHRDAASLRVAVDRAGRAAGLADAWRTWPRCRRPGWCATSSA